MVCYNSDNHLVNQNTDSLFLQNICMLSKIVHLFVFSFFKNNFIKTIIQESDQSVQKFGSRSGPIFNGV